ncbi:MAG: MarR family transcriptional regulator [Hyphomicrobiales bacterium]|nr:MarR family transcriptional regulator [Hyphomicrobiales bacterium]
MRTWFRLIRLETRIRVAIAERLRKLGLSTPQCDVLTTLSEREGVSQQELAERLYVTKGNISGLIDRLAAARLVERRSIAGDRRSRALYLTPKGRTAAADAIAVQRTFAAETIGALSAERLADFEALLMRVRDQVRAKTEAEAAGDAPARNRPAKATAAETSATR